MTAIGPSTVGTQATPSTGAPSLVDATADVGTTDEAATTIAAHAEMNELAILARQWLVIPEHLDEAQSLAASPYVVAFQLPAVEGVPRVVLERQQVPDRQATDRDRHVASLVVAFRLVSVEEA